MNRLQRILSSVALSGALALAGCGEKPKQEYDSNIIYNPINDRQIEDSTQSIRFSNLYMPNSSLDNTSSEKADAPIFR